MLLGSDGLFYLQQGSILCVGYVDMAGIAVGHIYYYLEDVYPRLTPYRFYFVSFFLMTPNFRTRLLKTPRIL